MAFTMGDLDKARQRAILEAIMAKSGMGTGGVGSGQRTGGLGGLRSIASPSLGRPGLPTTFDAKQQPNAPSFAPGGPVLNFTGGSPFPTQDRVRQAIAGLTLGTRLIEVMKQSKPKSKPKV